MEATEQKKNGDWRYVCMECCRKEGENDNTLSFSG